MMPPDFLDTEWLEGTPIPGFEILIEVLDHIDQLQAEIEAAGGSLQKKGITLPKAQADVLREAGAHFPFVFMGWEVRAAD